MNKIIKNSGKILISGLLIFSLVGCGKVPVLDNGEDAIVTSNNKNISVTEFYEKIKEKYSSREEYGFAGATLTFLQGEKESEQKKSGEERRVLSEFWV